MTQKETISCEEALKHLFDYLDRALAEHKHEEVEQHLSLCRSCYSRAEFERRLKAHLQDVGKRSAPEPLRTRIRQLIKKY